MRPILIFASVFLVVLTCHVYQVNGLVLGIDYGTRWMKLAVVHTGSIDVVLNEQSKRKTPSVVAYHHLDERFMGADGLVLATKFPKKVYQDLKPLLGQLYGNDSQSRLAESFLPYDLEEDSSRGTIRLRHSEELSFSVEELVAQQLSYGKMLAEKHANAKVAECVITVPPWFTHWQKRALIDAAELAGLKVLSLLPDGAAAALGYTMTRKFEKPENHIIFDVGADSVKATVVELSSTSGSSARQSVGHVKVLSGTHYDKGVGGSRFTEALARLLAKKFSESTKIPIDELYADAKAMAKILSAAEKSKIVLSANSETRVHLEELLHGHNLFCLISRDEFLKACDHLLERIIPVINEALVSANVLPNDLTSIILFGGGTRIPRIQELLKEQFGDRASLAQTLNTDEGAVLGAAFYAASKSVMHRVREVKVRDGVSLPIKAFLSTGRSAPLFPLGAATSAIKVLSFPCTEDVSVQLRYNLDTLDSILVDGSFSGDSIRALAASGNYSDATKISKSKLSLSIGLDYSGGPTLERAEVLVDEEVEVKEKVKRTKEEKESEGEDGKDVPRKPKYRTVKKKITHRYPMTSGTTWVMEGVPPMSEASRVASKQLLKRLDDAMLARHAADEAKNVLESYLYSMRDKLQFDEDIKSVSTTDEREKIIAALSEKTDWLYGEGDDASVDVYTKALADLKAMGGEEIIERAVEVVARPKAVEKLRKTVNQTRAQITKWKNDEYCSVSAGEIAMVDVLNEAASKWLDEQEMLQSGVQRYQSPVFTSGQVSEKESGVVRERDRLRRRPRLTPTPTPSPVPTVIPEKVETLKNGTDTSEIEAVEELEGEEEEE